MNDLARQRFESIREEYRALRYQGPALDYSRASREGPGLSWVAIGAAAAVVAAVLALAPMQGADWPDDLRPLVRTPQTGFGGASVNERVWRMPSPPRTAMPTPPRRASCFAEPCEADQG